MEDMRHALKPGMIVKVHQKIKDVGKQGEEKIRIQIFEGTILVVKHGSEPGATVTVRKVSNGIGVEKIFPVHSPIIEKIEVVREMAVHRSRAYYLRTFKKKIKEKNKKETGAKVVRIENEVAAPEKGASVDEDMLTEEGADTQE